MKVALGVVYQENAEITDDDQLKGKTLIETKGTTEADQNGVGTAGKWRDCSERN